jgi:hypothetical protein
LRDAKFETGIERFHERRRQGAHMPRFFFNFAHGSEVFEDAEGADLPDLTAVQDQTIEAARDVMRTRFSRHGPDWSGWWVRVKDETGNEVLAVPFSDVEGDERPPRG